jgi:hypothetical protein
MANFIQFEDEEMLRNMLGCNAGELPQCVTDEYMLRRGLFTRSLGSNAMGRAMLVDLVRACGLTAPAAPKAKDRINWHIQPQDGSLRVDAMFSGQLRRGSFLGFVGGGTLKIKLDGDPVLREFVSRDVQIAEDQSPLEPPKLGPDDPTDVEEDEDDEPEDLPETDWDESDSDPVASAPPKQRRKKKGKKGRKAPKPEEEPEPPTDWRTVDEGASVWVGDKACDGEFVSVKDAETIIVQLDGEEAPREFPITSVSLAS